MSDNSTLFKIKRSNVHITADALKIWADTNLSDFKESNGLGTLLYGIGTRIPIIAYSAWRLLSDFDGIQSRQFPFLILLAILGAINVWYVIYSIQFSYTNNIPRSAIKHIEYNAGIPLLIYPHIVVHFEKNNRIMKRSFILSGIFQNNESKMDALQKLKEAGLINPGDEHNDLLDS